MPSWWPQSRLCVTRIVILIDRSHKYCTADSLGHVLTYFFIAFLGSDFTLRLWHCVCFTAFYRFLSLSRTLAILQFIRPEWLPRIIFQIICLHSFFLKTNKPEELNVGVFASLWKAVQRLSCLVAALSARMFEIDNIEVYLGIWCTKWHWVTSFLVFMAFPYHRFSNNSWYLFEVLLPSTA